MRIAYLAPFDLELPAGHVAHVLGAVRELAVRTERVTLFAATCPVDLRAQLDFKAVPTSSRSGLQSVSFGAACAAMLGRHLLKRSTDLVYTRYFKSVVASVAVAKAAGVPVVVEVNSSIVNERRNSAIGSMRANLEELEERVVFATANGAVCVTRAIELELRRRHPRAGVLSAVVENGVDTHIYRPLDRALSRFELGLEPQLKYVVFAGAFQVWQGIPDLLRAFATARKKVSDVHLLLVGDGVERQRILQLIDELNLGPAVTVTGFQSERDVAKYIASADLCVAPYNTDAVDDAEVDKRRYGARMRGSPLKVMTYMACGRAIITTHLAEAGAYLAERGLGVAVPPDNPDALAAALVAHFENPEPRETMARRALDVARAELGWSAAVSGYLELARQATQTRPGR